MNKYVKMVRTVAVAALSLFGVFSAQAEQTGGDIFVNKKIVWSGDSSNATLNVMAYGTGGLQPPKVLFMGGVCGAHSQAASTLINALDAAASVANVDYYLFPDHVMHTGSEYKDLVGSIKYGEKFSGTANANALGKSPYKGSKTDTLASDNHSIFPSICKTVKQILGTEKKTYDQIVLEFDENLIVAQQSNFSEWLSALDLPSGSSATVLYNYMKEVAVLLKPYYDNDNVIWIVPALNSSDTSRPFSSKYYVPCNYKYHSGSSSRYDEYKFIAMSSILYPKGYLCHWSKSDGGTADEFDKDHKNTTGSGHRFPSFTFGFEEKTSGTTYWRGEKVNQIYYNDSDKVVDHLKKNIKTPPYHIKLIDQVKAVDSGLTITDVKAQIIPCKDDTAKKNHPTNKLDWAESSTEWQQVAKWTPAAGTTDEQHALGEKSLILSDSNTKVSLSLTNITYDIWTRLQIGIVDDGRFRLNKDGAYMEGGKWKKDPNNGDAKAVLTDQDGNEKTVNGTAKIDVPWTYSDFTVTLGVSNGEGWIQNVKTNKTDVSQGGATSTKHRGKLGYYLKSGTVDGSSSSTYEQSFVNVQANHAVVANYEMFVGNDGSTPLVKEYDGSASVYPVTVDAVSPVPAGCSYEIRYSTSASGPFKSKSTFVSERTTAGDVGNASGTESKTYTYYYQIS